MIRYKFLGLYILIGIMVFLNHNVLGESKEIDSLKSIYVNSKNDLDKANALVRLSYFYLYVNTDSSLYYCELTKQLSEKINYQEGIANSEINTGNIYNLKGSYAIAMQHFLKAIEIGEKNNLKQTLVWGYANIGLIYLYQRKFKQAEEFTNKSLDKALELQDHESIANSYNNLGEIYNYQKIYNDALKYYIKSYKYNLEHNGSFSFKAMNLLNIGDVYLKTQQYDSSKVYFQKAKEIATTIEDTRSISICLYGLAVIDTTNHCIQDGYDKALLSLKLAQKINSIEEIRNSSKLLYELAKRRHDPVSALNFFEIASNANNTIYNLEKAKEIVELQAEFDINQKNKEIELQNEKLKKQKVFLFSSILVMVLLILLVFLLYFYQRKTKRINMLLTKQNDEILHKNKVITAQMDEIEAQRDEIIKQKTIIEFKNKNLTDSINYAQKIQGVLLSKSMIIPKPINDIFFYYQPKDIVSGDFYYLKELDDFIVLAVADCTGHGVPGAFMSMLGMTLLNEIFLHSKPSNAAVVLEELRQKVKIALNQTVFKTETKDGMDIALCMIDKNSDQIQYAGAYHPLILIRNGELIEHKATRNPVGVHIKEFPFENNIIKYQSNDIFYAFSDGFSDQVGGLSKQKFRLAEFKNLLVQIHQLPMSEQQNQLQNRLVAWKMDIDQTDDILVVGFKF